MDFNVDPVTIYAQGAAIFAGGIPMPGFATGQVTPKVEQYHTVDDRKSDTGTTARAQSDKPVLPDGTSGKELDKQPLISSIGIAMPGGEMKILLRKGATLPARCRHVFQMDDFFKGSLPTVLRIPVVEGEYTRRGDRNRPIGFLEIDLSNKGQKLPRDAEIEITIQVDASRHVTTNVFIPALEEVFENVLKYDGSPPDLKKLSSEFVSEKARMQKAMKKQAEYKARVQTTDGHFHRILEEGMMEDIGGLLTAAQSDPEAAIKCQKHLLELMILLDEVEDTLEMMQE
jgi:molecular chaperone DnaK (HSP70)